jgi:hypothetical protein
VTGARVHQQLGLDAEVRSACSRSVEHCKQQRFTVPDVARHACTILSACEENLTEIGNVHGINWLWLPGVALLCHKRRKRPQSAGLIWFAVCRLGCTRTAISSTALVDHLPMTMHYPVHPNDKCVCAWHLVLLHCKRICMTCSSAAGCDRSLMHTVLPTNDVREPVRLSTGSCCEHESP